MADRTPYLGPATVSTTRTPYLGTSTGSAPAAEKKKGGGGLVGTLEHLPGKTVSNLKDAAIGSVTGTAKTLYDFAVAPPKTSLSSQWKAFLLHGNLDSPPGDPFAQDFENFQTGTINTVKHPLRRPGDTLLLALPAVSGASKLAIATREGATGAKAGSFATRTLGSGGLVVHPEPSRTGLGQVLTRGTDTLLQNAADKNPAGRGAALHQRRISKTLNAEAKQAARTAAGPAQALLNLNKRLTPAEQKALEIVAEQAPLEGRITAAAARVTGARDKAARARHQDELDRLHAAKPLLAVGADGKPIFAETTGKLPTVYRAMLKVAGDRETLLKELGLLTDESALARKTSAAQVALGGSHREFWAPTPDDLKVGAAVRIAGQKTLGRIAEVHASLLDQDAPHTPTVFFPRFNRSKRVPIDRLEVPGKVTTRTVETPRTVEQAQARLEQLNAEHDTAVMKMARALFGSANRAETKYINEMNKKARKQASGVDSLGRARGSSGWKARKRKDVLDQMRQQVELRIQEAIAKNPDHPVLKRWQQRVDEILQLERALNPEFGEQINQAGLGTESRTVVTRSQKRSGIVGPEVDVNADAIRIPDVATRKGTKALRKQAKLGGQGSIGHTRAPGSVRHPYTGKLREEGHRRQDTAALVAESGLEAAKFAGLKHLHDLIRKAVTKTPVRPDDVAVRLDALKANDRMPLSVQKFLAAPEEAFQAATPIEREALLDKVRGMLFFPGENKGGGWHVATELDPAAKAEFERLYEAGKIGWVPKRLLGELGQPTAPLRAVAPGKAVGAVDAINNASRFAILYLKPAYALPNVLGNAALGILQQGWAAPRNLAQAAKLVQRLHDEDYGRIDAAMGEGAARALASHNQGRLSRVVDFAAGKWSSVVDTPFRRAAFIHEARRLGYKTPEQIHELLNRDAHDPELLQAGIRANRDAIDYENLSPAEREIVRRVVFFYPWVKGSTVYAGRFLREHPLAAGATVPLAQVGEQYRDERLGPVPSYLEGLIPFGDNRAINPSAVSVLGTPAEVAETVQGLASGNIPEAANLANFYTPALSLALAEATRTDPGTGITYKPGDRGFFDVAQDQLVGGIPLANLLRSLTGRSRSKLYPPTPGNAIGNFFLGGVYPRTINKPYLNQLAAGEAERLRTGR